MDFRFFSDLQTKNSENWTVNWKIVRYIFILYLSCFCKEKIKKTQLDIFLQ